MFSGITTLMRPLLKTAHSQPSPSRVDLNVASAPMVSNSRNLRLARRSSTRLQMEAICPFRKISTSSQVSSTSRRRCEESSRQISLASRISRISSIKRLRAGMDPPARKRLIELIREIREASDICLLLSSHLLRDVEETCDEVLILRNGQIASICNLVEERRANRKFLELETIGAEATFRSTLEGLGCECAVFSNGRIKVVMPENIEIREVFRVAADKGVQIRRMNHRRDSLEDIFLNAMEQTGAADGRI